jgi:hypothetical protein
MPLKQVVPAESAALSRFREEELKEIRRAIAGGVWRGVLIAQAAVLVPVIALVVMSSMMVSSELESTYSEVASQLEEPIAP